jgi:RNA polymerase sigma factor (sigma-70 family)
VDSPRYRAAVDEPLDSWFKREILVHEASLLRYLSRVWPWRDEIHDLRQEIYVRVYESAQRSRPVTPRAFIFAAARNLVADRIRRARVVSIEAVGDPDALNVLVDEASPERKLSSWQDLRRLTRALNSLPPRCREVVWLRKVDELPMKQIAEQLGVSIRTVEGQTLKGMRLLSDRVFGNERSSTPTDQEEGTEEEAEHGEP